MTSVLGLSPASAFDEASRAVVSYLRSAVPLGFWSVTRYDGERQVYLTLEDDHYGTHVGDSVPWTDSFCRHAVAGTGPQIAPYAMAVPVYAATEVAARLDIGTYVGIPIRLSDGEVFGTLCGLDPAVREAGFARHADLLELLTMLLARVLDADLERAATARAAEEALLLAETDALTGLLNRRGWDRLLDLEEQRCRRYGDPCSVLVLDLDGLREVNDTDGHDAGDAILRRAADTVRSVSRASDVLARLGGDEFGIIAAMTTERDAKALAERLQTALDRSGIECSIGLAVASMRTGLSAAWRQADQHMYESKMRRRLTTAC
jgi:diguanylate cyclase (GGDEF)-like protein